MFLTNTNARPPAYLDGSFARHLLVGVQVVADPSGQARINGVSINTRREAPMFGYTRGRQAWVMEYARIKKLGSQIGRPETRHMPQHIHADSMRGCVSGKLKNIRVTEQSYTRKISHHDCHILRTVQDDPCPLAFESCSRGLA